MKLLLSCGILLRDDLSLKPALTEVPKDQEPEVWKEKKFQNCPTRWMQWEYSCKDPRQCCHDKLDELDEEPEHKADPNTEIGVMIRNYLTVQTLQSAPSTCVGKYLWKLLSTFLDFSKGCRKIQKLKAQQKFRLAWKCFCGTAGFGIGGRWRGAK